MSNHVNHKNPKNLKNKRGPSKWERVGRDVIGHTSMTCHACDVILLGMNGRLRKRRRLRLRGKQITVNFRAKLNKLRSEINFQVFNFGLFWRRYLLWRSNYFYLEILRYVVVKCESNFKQNFNNPKKIKKFENPWTLGVKRQAVDLAFKNGFRVSGTLKPVIGKEMYGKEFVRAQRAH